jgi:signal transduction histidine kinase/CheY-like chemotaxis protein
MSGRWGLNPARGLFTWRGLSGASFRERLGLISVPFVLPTGRGRRQPLFRKYAAVFVILVCGALISSGALQLYFSYQENQAALFTIQQEKAAGAATQIAGFLQAIQQQLGGAVELGPPGTPVTIDQRRSDYLRLLRQAPAITEISYLDPQGLEQLRISRLAMNVVGSRTDYSQDPRFLQARGGSIYYSPVYFRNESEPYMTIAIAEGAGPNAGVSVAEVNLKFIWDVVSQIKIGQKGYAYVVDSTGRLIAHPDISLVLQQTDLSALPQVAGARAGGDPATVGVDGGSHEVMTARQTVDPPGWFVFVEQPLEEAFAPLYASLLRTVLLVLAGVGLSVLASVFLARRMVRPIEALQAGASQIGAGTLDHRIDVHTGDELEDLADGFNQMTGQLRDSYATLEQKVDERTRDLADALEQLRALGEVSQAVNSSLDLQTVLTTIVTHAVDLSGTDGGAIYEFDEAAQEFQLRATHGMSAELIGTIREAHIRLGQTVIGEAAVKRAPVQTPDVREQPDSALPAALEKEGFRALLAVPLLREEQVVGALVVRRTAPGPFPQETVDLLQTLATQSVLAIHNARLFHEIELKSRQLEVASHHKSEFLANMSHELRTPLNAIIGFSEVLIERLFGDLNDKQAEYLDDILGSGRHLLSLINDILDLSKVEAGRMELDLGIFALSEALENGLTMVRERASQHGVSLGLEVDESIGLIEADERKVKQVIFNLLSNAVKFTPDGGRVDVAARLMTNVVQVSVHDTGIGIAPEHQARIFEEFQQAPSGQASTREGTGLGLALARRFVELHGGRLWVDSRVGVGSTFSFSLPVLQALAPSASLGAAPDSAAPLHVSPPSAQPHAVPLAVSPQSAQPHAVPLEAASRRVLVVEDNPQALDLLKLYLEGDGFSVAVAQDGETALGKARELLPDAMVLDILLPRLDGWDVLARAKADPAIADIPIVVVSMLDQRGKGFSLGAADYLVKPVQREALLATLRRLTLAGNGSTGQPHVLAIDDDPMALELIGAILAPAGYRVVKATDGKQGIAAAKMEHPGLVIVDLLMPEMDGFTVVEHLRADPTTAGIPIVILTSRSIGQTDRERLHGQISHLAHKSTFSRGEFVELVRKLCPLPEGARARQGE